MYGVWSMPGQREMMPGGGNLARLSNIR